MNHIFRLCIASTACALGSVSAGPQLDARAADESEVPVLRVIDFSSESSPWRVINDGVMGGLSSSRIEIEDGVAVFSGSVSLANNGGFASVRSLPVEHDLGAFEGIALRVRSDGKRYSLRLRTTDTFDGVSYQTRIQPPAGQWQEVFVAFDAFKPVFRGRAVPGHPPLDPSAVRTFGFLIADKQAGPFRLEIEWIAGARPQHARSAVIDSPRPVE